MYCWNLDIYSEVKPVCYRTCISHLAVCFLSKSPKTCCICSLKCEKFLRENVCSIVSVFGVSIQKVLKKSVNYSKTGLHRYEPAKRTLYSLLANLFALNLKNNFIWEKNVCNFPQLLSKGSGELTFKGLTITGATTCNDCGAAGAWSWVLLVINIFKPISKSSSN